MVSERANRVVQIAAELTGADDAFMVRHSNDGVIARLDQTPEPELAGWARERLRAAFADDETAAVEGTATLVDLNYKTVNGLRYGVAPLWARVGHRHVVVGALALGFHNGATQLPTEDVLRVMASALVEPEMRTEPSV